MSDTQKADPKARRRALLAVLVGTLVGASFILSFESYRAALQDWILSEPGQSSDKIKLVLLTVAVVLSAPLLVFGAYIWVLGARVTRAQQYPPPVMPVFRDTRIVRGQPAVLRGNIMKVLAVCLIVAALVTPVVFWRLAAVFVR
jgi:hypothetical protein